MDRITTRSSLCDGCPKEDWCQHDCFEAELYEKLARYEDLEEQGRLIEQKHGHWELRHVGAGHCWKCSVCHTTPGIYMTKDTNYCPNCRAKMESEVAVEVMGDLISRKALLEFFDPDNKEMPWAIAVRSKIIQQPTAYDPDKVVEALDKEYQEAKEDYNRESHLMMTVESQDNPVMNME